MKITTLCYFIDQRNDKILLALKKRGLGAGKWNGPGGKVEGVETIEEACKRECREETGLNPLALSPKGCIEFLFEKNQDWNNRCHIFLSEKWSGDLQETEEMKPEWFPLKNIPYEKMWEDDKIWLPSVLSGKSVYHRITFAVDGSISKIEDTC